MTAIRRLAVLYILGLSLLLAGCASHVGFSNNDQSADEEIYSGGTRTDFLSLVAQILAHDDLTDILFIAKIFDLSVVQTNNEVYKYQRDGNEVSRTTWATILKKQPQSEVPGLGPEILVSVSTYTYLDFKRSLVSGQMNPAKQCVGLDDLYSFFPGWLDFV